MARILIVGCGCRGRQLAVDLRQAGHLVRGTTRDSRNYPMIEAAGAEPVIADPNLLTTLVPALDEAAAVVWALGSASGDEEAVADLHGARLERLLETIVDTAVRGFVYEAAGSLPEAVLDGGAQLVERAAHTWQIPVEIVRARDDGGRALFDAVLRLVPAGR